jgi:hypothetical protein
MLMCLENPKSGQIQPRHFSKVKDVFRKPQKPKRSVDHI